MAATDRAGGRAGWLDGLAGVIIFTARLPATQVAVAQIDPLFLTIARAVPLRGPYFRAGSDCGRVVIAVGPGVILCEDGVKRFA